MKNKLQWTQSTLRVVHSLRYFICNSLWRKKKLAIKHILWFPIWVCFVNKNKEGNLIPNQNPECMYSNDHFSESNISRIQLPETILPNRNFPNPINPEKEITILLNNRSFSLYNVKLYPFQDSNVVASSSTDSARHYLDLTNLQSQYILPSGLILLL